MRVQAHQTRGNHDFPTTTACSKARSAVDFQLSRPQNTIVLMVCQPRMQRISNPDTKIGTGRCEPGICSPWSLQHAISAVVGARRTNTPKARGSRGGSDPGGPKEGLFQRCNAIASPDDAGAPPQGGVKGFSAGSLSHLWGGYVLGGAHSRHKLHDRGLSTRQAAPLAPVPHLPRRSRA